MKDVMWTSVPVKAPSLMMVQFPVTPVSKVTAPVA
jgi:hypothetical protein